MEKEKTNNQSRSWCLTQRASDYTQEELTKVLSEYTFIAQLEKGEKGGEQGYEHYQIYIENETPIRFSTLKLKLPNAHIEVRQAKKRIDAYNYVTKSETRIGEPFGNGEIKLTEEQGKRNDLANIIQLLELGSDLTEIRQLYPTQFLLYQNRIKAYFDIIKSENVKGTRRKLKVTYIYGKTGTGKTSYVLDKYGDKNVFIMTGYGSGYGSEEKFDGYNGEDVILFDEFRSSIPLTRMLRYLDVYYCELPARYNFKTACYTKVYITSNWSLSEQYKNKQEVSPEDFNAFKRRIHEVYNFDIDKENPEPQFLKQLTLINNTGLPF